MRVLATCHGFCTNGMTEVIRISALETPMGINIAPMSRTCPGGIINLKVSTDATAQPGTYSVPIKGVGVDGANCISTIGVTVASPVPTITFDHAGEDVCGDGEVVAMAEFDCPVPIESVSWSLGAGSNEENFAIARQSAETSDPQATSASRFRAVLRTGTVPGNGEVDVKLNFCGEQVTHRLVAPGLNQQTLEPLELEDGSGCCGSQPQPGSGSARINSVNVSMSLGTLADGSSAGSIRLIVDRADPDIGTRSLLTFDTSSSEIIRYVDNDGLRQVKTSAVLADIVTIEPDEYEVRFYAADDVVPTSSGDPPFETVQDAEPFAVWVFEEPPSSSGGDELIVSRHTYDSVGQVFVKQAEYVYAYTETDPDTSWAWVLTTKDGSGSVQFDETVSWEYDSGEWTHTYLATKNSTIIRKIIENWTEFAWGRSLTERNVKTGSGSLITTHEYYTSGPAEGRLGLIKYHDGSWIGYFRHPRHAR